MLFISVVALSLASSVLATPFKRFDGITVEVSGPSGGVKSVDDLKFTAAVTNTGSEAVKILKYGTILDDKLPTRSFTVTKDGATVPFTGVKLSISLDDLDDTAFTVIPAGETVTVNHEIASLFDFASAGAGKFSFEPVTTFQVQGVQERVAGGAHLSKIETASSSVEVEVTGDLANRVLQAKSLASIASSYVTSKGVSDSLYKAYWGANAASRVTSVLNAVASESSGSRTLGCTDSLNVCGGGVIAYTVTSTTNVSQILYLRPLVDMPLIIPSCYQIYYCSIFFNEVATTKLCSGTTVNSRNIRGGTTLHELTHALSGTTDITYGCPADQALSDANKIKNADNFNDDNIEDKPERGPIRKQIQSQECSRRKLQNFTKARWKF
ncbi:hypothetical protein DXG03_008752 [Asterophora parasitica]|uniref:Lysine-specific metallo-endopeptidase domain-containing protein n=1 Tax=Asterophora parasitica TaxID=117018 RepID=A0A9P7G555_9AGAR|nr:hypothetical protein DXG03_008752 [Asterophora parasitica]